MFSFDFGFYNFMSYKLKCFEKMCYFLKCLILTCTALLYLAEEEFDISIHPWVMMYLIQYFIYVLVLIFFRSDSTLYKFECEIKDIDKMMKCEGASRVVEKRKALSIVTYSLIPLLLTLHSCAYLLPCSGYITSSILYIYLLTALETVMILNTFIFYSIYYRFVIFESNLRASSHDDLSYLFHIYQLYTDVAEKYKRSYDHLVSIRKVINMRNFCCNYRIYECHYPVMWVTI